VAVAAGLATLRLLQAGGIHELLAQAHQTTDRWARCRGAKNGVVFSAQAIGGMFGLYFRSACPQSYAEVMECDKDAFNRFFHAMLDAGHYFAPSAFEAGFVSAAHSEADIAATIAAAEAVFKAW
jgi:glutamate-1-semialdehyde 2,1-aminomutase